MIKEMTRMRGCRPSSLSFSLCLLYIWTNVWRNIQSTLYIHTWDLRRDRDKDAWGGSRKRPILRVKISRPGILLQCCLSFLYHPQTNFSKECFATNGHEVKLLFTFPRMKVCRKLIRCGIQPGLRSRKNTLAY